MWSHLYHWKATEADNWQFFYFVALISFWYIFAILTGHLYKIAEALASIAKTEKDIHWELERLRNDLLRR
jgi:hypothetical protein